MDLIIRVPEYTHQFVESPYFLAYNRTPNKKHALFLKGRMGKNISLKKNTVFPQGKQKQLHWVGGGREVRKGKNWTG